MRLPQHLLESPTFLFSNAEELISALGEIRDGEVANQIRDFVARGLPPAVSRHVLATAFGLNPGLIWSFENRPRRHYRTFSIPKGRGTRLITAPRVALKIVQKWLGFHLARATPAPEHIFGFVPGRSHIAAAHVHCGAEWAVSFDIASFFQTTPAHLVTSTFQSLGYEPSAAKLLTSLTCLNGFLAQGSPSSPALSNLCFVQTDNLLVNLSTRHSCKVTRYADDVVFSGQGMLPQSLREEVNEIFSGTPWKLAAAKEIVQPLKGRIKVYGLLVDTETPRFTKGYRNKLRAYSHILATRGNTIKDRTKLVGHIQYARHVEATVAKLNQDGDTSEV